MLKKKSQTQDVSEIARCEGLGDLDKRADHGVVVRRGSLKGHELFAG